MVSLVRRAPGQQGNLSPQGRWGLPTSSLRRAAPPAPHSPTRALPSRPHLRVCVRAGVCNRKVAAVLPKTL